MASHQSAERNALVVRLNFEQRDAMIADDPGTYYLKPHYVGYPSALVRLLRVSREALKDLLLAWREVDASAPKRTQKGGSRETAFANERQRESVVGESEGLG